MNFTPSNVEALLPYVPLLPLLGAVVNGLLGRRLGRANVNLIGPGVVLASFLIS